jgi:hypothetical protein
MLLGATGVAGFTTIVMGVVVAVVGFTQGSFDVNTTDT